ncbi:MAG: hypothetical protein RLZZ626_772 [Actinomycetota bacterium]|jgi:tight adherence protein B
MQVARETGGATAQVLRRIEKVERDLVDAAERVRIAEVAPRATARLITWLPLAGILVGQLLGIDIVGALGQPIGQWCLGIGALMLWLAGRWMKRITKSASDEFGAADVALPLDLMAVALSAGEFVSRARVQVRRLLAESGIELDPAVGQRFDELVSQALETGQSISAALQDAADEFREAALRERLAKIERVGVNLTLPLGLVALPAFALMTVVPSAIASLRAAS